MLQRIDGMKVRVWDLPTRLFHWCTATCFVGLVVSGQYGGGAMVWHFRLGYTLLTLLLFRIIWGVCGGYWSRFSSFVTSPFGIARYIRNPSSFGAQIGHNPLGALSVLGLIFFLFIQIAAGLMSDDEVFTSGPLVGKVPAAWVEKATFFHTEIGKVVLICLVVLHLAAIAWYRLKKNEDLVSAMVSGDKEVVFDAVSSRDDRASRAFAVFLLTICGLAVAGLVWWAQARA
jgi:cytochrome b